MAERGNRLVIFIDELDRCKPTFAVHLLEQIKHYIFDDRITFVFSINLEQLQHTIKHYYGADFDSCRYLDRFFDLRVSMPPANMEKFYSEIGLESRYYVDIVTKRIINMYNFELREITRFYSQIKAAVYEPTHDSEKYDFLDDFCSGDALKIMLSHRPDSFVFSDASSVWSIDYVLCGHNHGGQVILPFIGGLFGGDQGFLPEYASGIHRFTSMQMIITRGLSSNPEYLPRFNNPPEIVCLDFESY